VKGEISQNAYYSENDKNYAYGYYSRQIEKRTWTVDFYHQ